MLAGGGTLYLYALGMGIPLVVVTLFGNKLIPRSGPWMQYVKEAFGFVILALPVFYWKGCWGCLGFTFMEPAGRRVLWLGVCIEPESARWLGAGLPVIALGRTVDRGSPLARLGL